MLLNSMNTLPQKHIVLFSSEIIKIRTLEGEGKREGERKGWGNVKDS